MLLERLARKLLCRLCLLLFAADDDTVVAVQVVGLVIGLLLLLLPHSFHRLARHDAFFQQGTLLIHAALPKLLLVAAAVLIRLVRVSFLCVRGLIFLIRVRDCL